MLYSGFTEKAPPTFNLSVVFFFFSLPFSHLQHSGLTRDAMSSWLEQGRTPFRHPGGGRTP